MQATETSVMDYGCPIQGGSPDLGKEGASHGRRGRSPLDCEGADGAASGTDHPEPGHGIQREGSERLRAAIDKLRSLHDGDRGVIEIAACGPFRDLAGIAFQESVLSASYDLRSA
jgi:hypothetical protein